MVWSSNKQVIYALAELLGGNGYLSVYIIGIVLGNQDFQSKRNLVAFFDGINMLAQILIFFVLGLLSDFQSIVKVFPAALIVMLFMTIVSRPVSIFGLMLPMKNSSMGQKLVVSWAGIRGAASIVFAIVAVSSVTLQYDLFHIVFTVVLLSLAIQGGLMPAVAIKTKMYNPEGDILKTFSDYEEERNIEFVMTEVCADHPWVNKTLQDIFLPKDIRVVVIERGEEHLLPSGQTLIKQGDRLILSALNYDSEIEHITLRERTVEAGDRFEGRLIKDLKLHAKERSILLERAGEIILPTGDVQIMKDDLLVSSRLVK